MNLFSLWFHRTHLHDNPEQTIAAQEPPPQELCLLHTLTY